MGVESIQSFPVPLASVPFETKNSLKSTLALKTSKSFIQIGEYKDFTRIGHCQCVQICEVFRMTLPCLMVIISGIRNMLLKVASFYCILNVLSPYDEYKIIVHCYEVLTNQNIPNFFLPRIFFYPHQTAMIDSCFFHTLPVACYHISCGKLISILK